jgi:hypothetical protein
MIQNTNYPVVDYFVNFMNFKNYLNVCYKVHRVTVVGQDCALCESSLNPRQPLY